MLTCITCCYRNLGGNQKAGQTVRIKDPCLRTVLKAFCLEGHSLLENTVNIDKLKRAVTKVNLMFLLEW